MLIILQSFDTCRGFPEVNPLILAILFFFIWLNRLQGNVVFSLIWQWPELGLNTAVSGHGIKILHLTKCVLMVERQTFFF